MYEYDVYEQRCPTRMVLERLADKWVVLVLGRLSEQPLRFNQLRREVQGVSQKVLSQILKKLERDGLVNRRAFATVPVTVEYDLTPLGRTLTAPLSALTDWAETHIESVLTAQQQYDSAQGERDAEEVSPPPPRNHG